MTERQAEQGELALRAQLGDQEAQLLLWESVERLLFQLCAVAAGATSADSLRASQRRGTTAERCTHTARQASAPSSVVGLLPWSWPRNAWNDWKRNGQNAMTG